VPDGATTVPIKPGLHRQSVTAVLPTSLVLVSGGHERHAATDALPVLLLYVPTGHAVMSSPSSMS
jgi:hypothetical protein